MLQILDEREEVIWDDCLSPNRGYPIAEETFSRRHISGLYGHEGCS